MKNFPIAEREVWFSFKITSELLFCAFCLSISRIVPNSFYLSISFSPVEQYYYALLVKDHLKSADVLLTRTL